MVYDTGVPPTPTGLAATTPTNPKPVLTWLSGGADNLSGFDHYNVYRTGTLIATTTALTFTDNALSASGTQTYTVKAVDAAGNLSNASTGKAVIWDPLTPNAPGKPTIPSPATHPSLTWSAATDTGGSLIARYDIYRGSTLAGSSTTTTFVDPASLADATYTYKVVAIDGAGNVSIASPVNSVIVDATAPTAPTGVTGITPTTAKPALSWSPATDNVGGSGVARYNVYRGIVLAGSSTGTTFTDNGLTVNGTYGYTVRAVDAAGNEGPAVDPVRRGLRQRGAAGADQPDRGHADRRRPGAVVDQRRRGERLRPLQRLPRRRPRRDDADHGLHRQHAHA